MKAVHVWINDGTNSHPDPDNPPLSAGAKALPQTPLSANLRTRNDRRR